MNLIVCHIAFLILMSVFATPEATGKNNKIKIIVPHKISYVHHHHHPRSWLSDMRTKKKFYLGPNVGFNDYEEEEEDSEEREESNEDRYGRYSDEQDEELDESRAGFHYYAMPGTRYPGPAPASIFMKPVFLHNDETTVHRFRHPPTYAVVRYGDYFPRERRPEQVHSMQDFDYK